jgi:glycerol-1-phosphate dehydrogenase [NAD(P)+]
MNLQFKDKELIVDSARCRRWCTCRSQHPVVDVRHFTGKDAYERLAADCRQLDPQGGVLLVDDENTHVVAGHRIAQLLKERRIPRDLVTLPGRTAATGEVAEKIVGLAARRALVVGVGAGTINDLGKYAAGRQGTPYWSVPTAPSMNGFTSAIAAIKIAGVKRTLPSPPPQFVYIHPEVIRTAPLPMRQAGLCDLMAKSVSDIDWQIESMLFSGTYCRLPSAMVTAVEAACLKNPAKIESADRGAVLGLMKGLLTSGVAMSLAGSSAPASGGEHLFSHFLDMRADLTGRAPELHGLQVAAGIVLSASCYRRLAALDPTAVGSGAEKSLKSGIKELANIWGPLAPEVEKRLRIKLDLLRQLADKLPRHWDRIRTLCRQVRSPRDYATTMRRSGYPLTLEALNLTRSEFLLAASAAGSIRERLTVLDIAAQCGVLEAAADDALALLETVS